MGAVAAMKKEGEIERQGSGAGDAAGDRPAVAAPRYESPSELRGFRMSSTGTALGVGGPVPGERVEPIFDPGAEPELSPEQLAELDVLVQEGVRNPNARRHREARARGPGNAPAAERRELHPVPPPPSIPTVTHDTARDEAHAPARPGRTILRPALAVLLVAAGLAVVFALWRSDAPRSKGATVTDATSIPSATVPQEVAPPPSSVSSIPAVSPEQLPASSIDHRRSQPASLPSARTTAEAPKATEAPRASLPGAPGVALGRDGGALGDFVKQTREEAW
jgi:hypothetical protein